MVVMITGSRAWKGVAVIRSELEALPKGTRVIHGACPRGADAIADRIARELGLEVVQYPADWARYGISAGPKRNVQMVEEGNPDEVWAFVRPESVGTYHAIKVAESHKVPVRKFFEGFAKNESWG